MHIEVYKTDKLSTQPWRWRFMNGGRITAGNESHPSKDKAIRAARSIIIGAFKEQSITLYVAAFSEPLWSEKKQCFIVRWNSG